MRERKKGQRAPKGTARRPQEHPTGAPEGPTGAQEAPKSTQNDPERTPRWLQEPPKAAQDSPDHVDVNRRQQIVKVDKTLSLWGTGGTGQVPVGGGYHSVIGGRFRRMTRRPSPSRTHATRLLPRRARWPDSIAPRIPPSRVEEKLQDKRETTTTTTTTATTTAAIAKTKKKQQQ